MNDSTAKRNTHATDKAKRTDEKIEIRTQTGPFAMVPAWLYDAVGEMAQSLYGRLWLRANWSTGVEDGLTRAEIAELMGWSVDKVDRYTKELETAGALLVKRRASRVQGEHRNLPNVYVLVQSEPEEVAANLRLVQDVEAANLRLGKPQECGYGSRKSAALYTEGSEETEKDLPASPEKRSSVAERATYPEDFETFWKAYPPDRGGKRDAFARWTALRKAKQLPPLDDLLEALDRYKASKRVRDGFVKEASTWLNKGCWDTGEDVAPEKAPAAPKSSTFRQLGDQWIEYLPEGGSKIHDKRPAGAA